MSFRALVVDDEPLARDGLVRLLREDAEIAEVSEARDGQEAVIALKSRAFDLVFLDVQMPELDGLSALREAGPVRIPALVFVTAHDRYAVHAFELHAVDYLLKPVTRERFRRTLAKAKEWARISDPESGYARVLALLESIRAPRKTLERLAVRSGSKTIFVPVADIERVEAAENYVEVHATGRIHMIHVPIGTMERSLDPEQFVRVHRSAILNVQMIQELQPGLHGEYTVTMRSGFRLQTGRTYSDRVRALTVNPF